MAADEIEVAPPEVTVHIMTPDGPLAVCICRSCRSSGLDTELRAAYGSLLPWYRKFKRQQRMRRKKRRGWM